MKVNNLFHKVEKAEREFLNSEFIAPVAKHSKVGVRILGLVYEFSLTDSDFEGWVILKPISSTHAKVIGSPSFLQISEYLERLSKARMILCERRKGTWIGMNKQLFGNQFPVLLADGIQLFDEIVTRWDGANFWFEEKDRSTDPSLADYLRRALANLASLDKLRKSGLDPFHREAYQWQLLLKEKKIGEVTIDKIKRAVLHAGGFFKSYIEHHDSYTVIFAIGEGEYRATIEKNDFEVLSAGICLSGEDKKFDLQSLVSVVKEGQEKNKIYREGGEEE
ncbi:hypothetical protein ES703_40124 [subsurface metagenome]